MPDPLSDEDVAQIQAAIFAGNKIQAIKLYRERAGTDLKGAKDFVDALSVELRNKSPEKFTASTGGCAGVLLVGMSLVGAALWAWC